MMKRPTKPADHERYTRTIIGEVSVFIPESAAEALPPGWQSMRQRPQGRLKRENAAARKAKENASE